jgi:hypothetical protein
MKREEHIAEMSERLQNLHAADREVRRGDVVLRCIEDPLKPRTENGKLHRNRILLLLGALAILAGGTFLFFSVVQL